MSVSLSQRALLRNNGMILSFGSCMNGYDGQKQPLVPLTNDSLCIRVGHGT